MNLFFCQQSQIRIFDVIVSKVLNCGKKTAVTVNQITDNPNISTEIGSIHRGLSIKKSLASQSGIDD